MNETRFPLCWPDGWKRTADRKRGTFGSRETIQGQTSTWTRKKQLSVAEGIYRVLDALRAMGIDQEDVIISTNMQTRLDGLPYSNRTEPNDPGVAVYWRDSNQRRKCMAIDAYDRLADNIGAVAATLEAMRAIQRHGGGEILERTFLGFAQLPERRGKHWREILGFGEGLVTKADIDSQFKVRARQLHPDQGGKHAEMAELNAARQNALLEVV